MPDPAFYTRLRDSTVTPLIDRFGAASLHRHTEEVYDPTTGTTETVNTDTSVVAVRLEYEVDMIDGDTVLSGDFQLYISAGELGTRPEPGDYVFFGSSVESEPSRFRVVQSSPLHPGPIGLMYTLQVRR